MTGSHRPVDIKKKIIYSGFMKLSAEYQPGEVQRLIAILSDAAAEISRLETSAKTLLYEKGDKQGYHEQLRQKAILLCELAEEAQDDALPPQLKALVKERVGSFSYEAERALRLDSVFYMAVLLYPEGHQDGQPNELENLICHLSSPCNTLPKPT